MPNLRQALLEGRLKIATCVVHERGLEVTLRRDALQPLAPREREVVTLAMAGHSNKAIAFEIGVAPSRVSETLARARRKLGATSTTALLAVLASTELCAPFVD